MPPDDLVPTEVLSAKLSATAIAGWRKFCDDHGISVSAMIEVAGRDLLNESMPPAPMRERMVAEAREVDRQRRRRRR